MTNDELSQYLEKLEGIQNGFQSFSITDYLWIIPIFIFIFFIFIYINYRLKVKAAKKGAYQALKMWEEEKKKIEQEKTNIQ